MKREIKFRGKDTETGEWHYGYVDYNIYNNLSLIHTEASTQGVSPETVGQYTGFKDKNGKYIYEGDILSDWTETDEGMKQSRCQVFFNEMFGQWELDISYHQDKSTSYLLENELRNYEYEIIGNIYS